MKPKFNIGDIITKKDDVNENICPYTKWFVTAYLEIVKPETVLDYEGKTLGENHKIKVLYVQKDEEKYKIYEGKTFYCDLKYFKRISKKEAILRLI